MCGIAGFIALASGRSAEDARETVRRMVNSLRHRGPDSEGIWCDDAVPVFLGHRRLAILDLSPAGRQPMVSQCGRYALSYNGEIYNFRDVRKNLEESGMRFRGSSDTEVLAGLFARKGFEQALQEIRGMFALALWDRRDRRLTLIRDHVGKKPLYFGFGAGGFMFGSELKALRAASAEKPAVSRGALALYARYGYIPAPWSIYENIYKLPAGHSLSVAYDDLRVLARNPEAILDSLHCYWSPEEAAREGTARPYADREEAAASLKAVLARSVRERMVADVPLGAFLSGGIDSSLIAALMQEHSSTPVRTYTVGFEEAAFDESAYAAEVAARLGTDHHSYIVTAAETRSVIPGLPDIYDEPFADMSQIPTWHVCRMARADTVVALGGDGGDEVFCGYTRYFMAARLFSAMRHVPLPARKIIAAALRACPAHALDRLAGGLRPYVKAVGRYELSGRRLHSIAGYMSAADIDAMIRAVLSYWPDPCALTGMAAPPDDLLSRRGRFPGIRHDLDRMMLADQMFYLPEDILVKTDRASMAVSLEVRSPLLDRAVIGAAWRMPVEDKLFPEAARGKKPLYDLLLQYVPEDLVNRPKQGFAVPMERWLKTDLRAWAEDLLSPAMLEAAGLFDVRMVRKAWNDFTSHKTENTQALWIVLMAQAWHQRWCG